jgi:cold shock CspA family protein
MNKPERHIGHIKFFREPSGYGFITRTNTDDLFSYHSQWVEDDVPQRGEPVSFIIDRGRDSRPVAGSRNCGKSHRLRTRTRPPKSCILVYPLIEARN